MGYSEMLNLLRSVN